MGQILQAGGLSGGRQGVMKEKIVDIHIAEEGNPALLEEAVRHMIGEGYQPIPQTYSVTADGLKYSMVMIKTEMKIETI